MQPDLTADRSGTTQALAVYKAVVGHSTDGVMNESGRKERRNVDYL